MENKKNDTEDLKEDFKIQTYTNKEMAQHYRVSTKTFGRYLKTLKVDLGTRIGNSFSPKQVKMIVDHLGKPFILIIAVAAKIFAGAEFGHKDK